MLETSFHGGFRGDANENWLLACLPADDHRRLVPDLRAATIRSGQVLHRQAETVERVYFLRNGLCSIGRETEDGQTIEVASVGNEGLVGISAVFGAGAAERAKATMLVGGDAYWMRTDIFREEIDRRGALHSLVNRYLQNMVADLVTCSACNALHPIHRRLARWLLQAQDRLANDVVALSHETLAAVLGVRRASVTLAAIALHQLGLIDYAHKHIQVRDRHRLERAACECYSAMRMSFARPGR